MRFSIGNYCGYAKRYCSYCSEFYLGHCELTGYCVYKKIPYETANVHQGGKGMNYKEAIDVLKCFEMENSECSNLNCERQSPECAYERAEAFKLAYECLEKAAKVVQEKESKVMGENKLLPCPFCGKAAELTDYDGSNYQVWCPHCRIVHFGIFSETIQGAIDKWNTRNGSLEEVKE